MNKKAIDSLGETIVIWGSIKDAVRAGVRSIVGMVIPGNTGKMIQAKNLSKVYGELELVRALSKNRGWNHLVESTEELIDQYKDLIAKTF